MQRSKVVADFEDIHRAVSALMGYVERHEKLRDFLPALKELEANARRLALGDFSLEPLRATAPENLPDRETAVAIVELVGRIAGPEDDDEPRVRRALAILHGNVVEAIMHAVFVSYPDAVPGTPDSETPCE